MKTVKVLMEELDSLKIEAQAIVSAAETAGRDLNDEENSRFDQITKVDVPEKQKDLARAQEIDREIVALNQKEDRRKRIEALEAETSVLSKPRVLPTNGRFGEEAEPQRVYHRLAKLKAFKDEQTAYNVGMWVRALVARAWNRDDKAAQVHIGRLGWQVTNTGTEGTGTSGGYLVPAPLSQTIIDVRESVGVTRQVAKIMPMTADTLTMPRRDGGLTVYYPAEASAITTSDKIWGQIELICKKRSVAHQISQELVDDALISIVDDAVNEMAYALALKEDTEFVNGDGTSTYGGVRGVLNKLGTAGVYTAPTGDETWAELAVDDFTSTMGLLPDKYSRNPSWVCSANFYYSVMVKVLLQGGGNTVMDLEAGPGQGRFFGRPVFFTDQMPKTTAVSQVSALYGSFDMGVILGERTGITFGRSDDYAFLNDVTTLKASTRYDIQVHAGGDTTNAGAYVGLKTAAA